MPEFTKKQLSYPPSQTTGWSTSLTTQSTTITSRGKESINLSCTICWFYRHTNKHLASPEALNICMSLSLQGKVSGLWKEGRIRAFGFCGTSKLQNHLMWYTLLSWLWDVKLEMGVWGALEGAQDNFKSRSPPTPPTLSSLVINSHFFPFGGLVAIQNRLPRKWQLPEKSMSVTMLLRLFSLKSNSKGIWKGLQVAADL